MNREMKAGNIGLAFAMVGKKLRSSLSAAVDLGLTGKDGVVHPSLTVTTHTHIPAKVLVFLFSSTPRCLVQDSGKKLEQNVALFGSTVESLLYRYGKVRIPTRVAVQRVGPGLSH